MVTGVPTGFVDLDEMTSGLQPSDLILVAARPSMGKTSFVLNIAQHVGTSTDMTVGFFSLEMSKEQLFMRMLTSEARIDAHRFRTGFLNEKDYGRLSHALGTLAEARVYIDDTASIGILEMRAKSASAEGGARAASVIVDYIQLMQGRGRLKAGDRSRRFRDRSRACERAGGADRALSQLRVHPRPDRSPPAAVRLRGPRPRTGCGRRDVSSARAVPHSACNPNQEAEGTAESSSSSSGTVRSEPRSWRYQEHTRFENLARVRGDGERRPVIRPTVARSISRPSVPTSAFISAFSRAGSDLDFPFVLWIPDEWEHRDLTPRSSRSSRRTPTATAPPKSVPRSKKRARRCWPARTIEEGIVLRRAGVRVPSWFGALGISDRTASFSII